MNEQRNYLLRLREGNGCRFEAVDELVFKHREHVLDDSLEHPRYDASFVAQDATVVQMSGFFRDNELTQILKYFYNTGNVAHSIAFPDRVFMISPENENLIAVWDIVTKRLLRQEENPETFFTKNKKKKEKRQRHGGCTSDVFKNGNMRVTAIARELGISVEHAVTLCINTFNREFHKSGLSTITPEEADTLRIAFTSNSNAA